MGGDDTAGKRKASNGELHACRECPEKRAMEYPILIKPCQIPARMRNAVNYAAILIRYPGNEISRESHVRSENSSPE